MVEVLMRKQVVAGKQYFSAALTQTMLFINNKITITTNKNNKTTSTIQGEVVTCNQKAERFLLGARPRQQQGGQGARRAADNPLGAGGGEAVAAVEGDFHFKCCFQITIRNRRSCCCCWLLYDVCLLAKIGRGAGGGGGGGGGGGQQEPRRGQQGGLAGGEDVYG